MIKKKNTEESVGIGIDFGASPVPKYNEPTFSAAETAVECEPRPLAPAASPQAAFPPADSKDNGPSSSTSSCTTRLLHPFQSFKIHRQCPQCALRRLSRLNTVTTGNEIKYEDWRWKVKYLSPVPEEPRHAEWGVVGEVMGSWVKDWKTKGDGLMAALREEAVQTLGGIEGSRGKQDGEVGFRRGMPSS